MKQPPEAYRFNSRLIAVDAGLHGLRYMSTDDAEEVPAIMIQALPSDAAAVDHLPAPGGVAGYLVAPGEMLILRAHRKVHIVATIVSTSDFTKSDALQLKIERLDRPARSASPRAAEPRAKMARPAPDAARQPLVEIVETDARAIRVDAQGGTASVNPPMPVPAPPNAPAKLFDRRRVPDVMIGLLVRGARSWRLGTLDDLSLAPGETVVGIRALSNDAQRSSLLRIHASFADGRSSEDVGYDVRVETSGSVALSKAVLQFKAPGGVAWVNLGELDFDAYAGPIKANRN